MISLRLSPRAETDLEEIGDYIADDNPERAVTYVDELMSACARIADNPHAFPMRPEIAPDIRMANFVEKLVAHWASGR